MIDLRAQGTKSKRNIPLLAMWRHRIPRRIRARPHIIACPAKFTTAPSSTSSTITEARKRANSNGEEYSVCPNRRGRMKLI